MYLGDLLSYVLDIFQVILVETQMCNNSWIPDPQNGAYVVQELMRIILLDHTAKKVCELPGLLQ